METSDKIVKKARPFFLNYFSKLANDLNTLTAAPVVCTLTSVELMRGADDLGVLFEKDRSVAYVKEDGLGSGDVHLVFDLATSIALTGLMMMMGEAVIRGQVKTRGYNEEIQEGFNEVSNQVVGAMNDLVEKKMVDGGHLLLESTYYVEFGGMPDTFDTELTTYLVASADIQVSDFEVEVCRWVLSKGFAEALLGIEIDGTPEEEAQAAARKQAAVAKREVVEAPNLPAFDEIEAIEAEDVAVGGRADAAEGPATTARTKAFDFASSDGLPSPDEPGSVKVVMTESPFSLKDDEKIMRAINAMRHDGNRYIGVEKKGKLIRVISQSDLRQVMGPFFGTKAMGPRDKAICTLPIGKLNENQQLIRITLGGTINQAADLLAEFNLRALPVVSNQGVLRGFVPVHAVMNFFRKKRMS